MIPITHHILLPLRFLFTGAVAAEMGRRLWGQETRLACLRILLVAEDGRVGGRLFQLLDETGAEVRVLARLADAEEAIARRQPRLIVIAGSSSGEATERWCARHRQKYGPQTPILVLGTQSCDAAETTALLNGADVFLPVTASDGRILAQLQAMARRLAADREPPPGSTETLRIDPRSHRVWAKGTDLRLNRRYFQLLYHLAAHPGEALTHEDLAMGIWGPGTRVHMESVNAYICRVRKSLREHGLENCIQTVHGVGYRFVPPEQS